MLGKHPGAVGSGAGTEIGTRGEMFPDERRERLGNLSRVRAERDAHAGVAALLDIMYIIGVQGTRVEEEGDGVAQHPTR